MGEAAGFFSALRELMETAGGEKRGIKKEMRLTATLTLALSLAGRGKYSTSR